MPPQAKKIVLPPRPIPRAQNSDLQASKNLVNDIRGKKAVEYRITLDDGSSLLAVGAHADLLYRYFNECEQICSQRQLVSYLGPTFSRVDKDGKVIESSVGSGPGAK